MAARLYHGSCRCEKVRFEVRLDLDAGTFKCNCPMCTKARFWGAAVKADEFRLLSGEEDQTMWVGSVRHFFCRHCGVKLYGRVEMPQGPMVSVSLAVLDDLDPRELSRAPVQYMDGRNGRWDREPDITGHL